MRERGSKLQRFENGATLYLPAAIARMIPKDARFICQLTEEGVMFRRVELVTIEAPSWVHNGTEPE
jgi:hypothetical protein